jgi:uncharacterized protein YoaH (UPF0181 family)
MAKKSMRLGGGGRFKKGQEAMERKGMSKGEAGAIMASEGRKKYGKKKMSRMAARGKMRKAKGR